MMAHQRHYFHTTPHQSIISIPITSTSTDLDLKKSNSTTLAHLQIPGGWPCETLISNSDFFQREAGRLWKGPALYQLEAVNESN